MWALLGTWEAWDVKRIRTLFSVSFRLGGQTQTCKILHVLR